MNERYFKFAREASKKADYRGGSGHPAIGGVALYKGSVVATAWNTNKTSPLQARYNIYRYNNPTLPPKSHCETVLLQRLRWKFGDNLDWSRVDIYLFRGYKNGELADSKPCDSCYHMLRDAGITHIYYTSRNGFIEERFK